MIRKLFSIISYFLPLTFWAQTSIFGEVALHNNAQVAFFQAPVFFIQGNIRAQDTSSPLVVFSEARQEFANDDSHVEVPILSRNHIDFTFPTGNHGRYQPLSINNGDNGDLMVFFKGNAYTDLTLPKEIDFISNQFHWLVSGDKTAQLGLSWNSGSLLNQMTDDLEEVVILGYAENGWELIPSQIVPFSIDGTTPVSIEEGRIVSQDKVMFNRYNAFTLGVINKSTTIMVSEALTPNGDNVNDTWYIENIDRYPDAVIRVFNRWGGEVFFHQGNYRNDWNGMYNNDLEILPAAPYFYRIDLDNDGYVEHQGWIYINY